MKEREVEVDQKIMWDEIVRKGLILLYICIYNHRYANLIVRIFLIFS